MRHYVTIDGSLYSQHGGNSLRQRAAANLSRWTIETGFPWRGIDLSGRLISAFPDMSLSEIGDRLELGEGIEVPFTRLVISDEPISDAVPDNRFDLLLSITNGESFSWRAGAASTAATITIDGESRLHKLEGTIIDLCQDIMIANSDLIQAILQRHLASGGTRKSFLKAKANFARKWHEGHLPRPTNLVDFEPTEYASFSALVRGSSVRTFDLSRERAIELAEIWKEFLIAHFREHFFDASEATEYVVWGSHRRARPERTAGGGKRKKANIARGDLSRSDLSVLFSDPQIVTHDGCYVLCISERRTPKRIGDHADLFGWKNPKQKTVHKLKLLPHAEYHKAVDLVREGQVTPIVTFLKRPS